jgi:hypothetical protein
MNYTKPEVNPLGQVKTAIESLGAPKPIVNSTDGQVGYTFPPAYDLDE